MSQNLNSSPEAIRRAVEEVFRRSEFQSSDREADNWLLRQMRDFFRWLGSLYDASPGLFWFFLIASLVALVGMILFLVFQVRSVFTASRDRARASAGQTDRVRRSAAFLEESDRRAKAGDYSEAIRFLFLALVYRFDERGRVSFDQSYTNREYLELLGDRPTVREALQVLVDNLDDHWYGQWPCRKEEYDTCRAAFDRLS